MSNFTTMKDSIADLRNSADAATLLSRGFDRCGLGAFATYNTGETLSIVTKSFTKVTPTASSMTVTSSATTMVLLHPECFVTNFLAIQFLDGLGSSFGVSHGYESEAPGWMDVDISYFAT